MSMTYANFIWNVLEDGKYTAPDWKLEELFAKGADPRTARDSLIMDDCFAPVRRKTKRKPGMSMGRCERAIAFVLLKECSRLLRRRLDPDVRARVIAIKAQADSAFNVPIPEDAED